MVYQGETYSLWAINMNIPIADEEVHCLFENFQEKDGYKLEEKTISN